MAEIFQERSIELITDKTKYLCKEEKRSSWMVTFTNRYNDRVQGQIRIERAFDTYVIQYLLAMDKGMI